MTVVLMYMAFLTSTVLSCYSFVWHIHNMHLVQYISDTRKTAIQRERVVRRMLLLYCVAKGGMVTVHAVSKDERECVAFTVLVVGVSANDSSSIRSV